MESHEPVGDPNYFELPDAPDFDSRAPRLPFKVSVALCEQTLEWAKSQPGFEERRYLTKCHAEFIL